MPLQHDLGFDDLAEAAEGVLELALVGVEREPAHEDPAVLLARHLPRARGLGSREKRREIRVCVRRRGGDGEGRKKEERERERERENTRKNLTSSSSVPLLDPPREIRRQIY